MNYTEIIHYDNVTVTRVLPLEPTLIRFALSVRVPKRGKQFTPSAINLYTALALTSTKKKSKEKLDEYLKRYGITLGVNSSSGDITFEGHVRAKNASYAVSILREILEEGVIHKEEFLEKKGLAIEHNREEKDNAKRIASISFYQSLYTKDSYLYPKTLVEELGDIRSVTERELASLTNALSSGEWFLTVVGNEDSEKAFLPLIQMLAPTAQNVERTLTLRDKTYHKDNFVTVPGKANIEVLLGDTVELTSLDRDYIPLDFGMNVLGKVGGFSGRLMSTVREKEGLTYGIYANLAMGDKGHQVHWNIRTFFTAHDYGKGIASTKRELTKIVERGITPKELVTFKEILKNSTVLLHDASSSRLSLYHALVRSGYTEAEYEAMDNRYQELTVREVNAALKKYIDPNIFVTAGAGPISTTGKPIIPSKT